MESRRIGKSDELDIYINELKDIEENKPTDETEITEEDTPKTPDEGEEEVAWLKEAGFELLASKFEEGKELEADVLHSVTSSLTKTQAAAVQKRVNTLNATLRKRYKSSTVPDVRDIFPLQGGVENQTAIARRESRNHRRSRTVPEYLDRPLIKTKEAAGIDSGIAEITTVGIKTLSLTHTLPVDVPNTSQTIEHNAELDTNDKSVEARLNITIVPDKLGLTSLDYLAPKDVDRIRSLALIELTAMFDSYLLSLRPLRRSGKKKYKETGLFGVPLHILLENDRRRQSKATIPLIFQQMMAYLKVKGIKDEGILRIPGSSTRMKVLRKELESQYSSGCSVFQFNNARSHDVAGLLKQFLRELPIPLLTLEYIQAFAMVENIPNRRQQIQALNLLILVLPDIYRHSLRVLLDFLTQVTENEPFNKMTIINVAMIMAPNLFAVQALSSKSMSTLEMQLAAGTSNVVRMLINYRRILWMVPSLMVLQLRHLYNNEIKNGSSKKSKDSKYMNFFHSSRKGRDDSIKKSDYKEGVIRVQAPQFTQITISMQLTDTTTAADVVAKFKRSTVITETE
uniref:Rho GTPase-activating protein 18-like n=1 Tax=Saccoglossus kowalevskii TaxID=10224 RepID=A0ABM0MFV6_SACKO